MSAIVTAGEILVELMAERVGQGYLEPGSWLGPYPSGAPAILADQAARCGAEVAILACVGDDDFGRLNLRRLADAGVDTGAIRTVGATTGCAFVAYREDGGRDFVYHLADSAAGRLRREHVDAAAFADCRWFHVMGSSLFDAAMTDAVLHAARTARAAGARLSFDPNVRKELLARPGVAAAIDELARDADLLLASEDDVAHLAPGLPEAEAVARLLDGRASRVLLKRGARGSALHERAADGGPARVLEQPAFAVEEVDPTGAGDCFGGTFLACLVQGLPAAECLRNAAAAGAMAVRRRGPLEGNSTLGQIARFLDDHPPSDTA